MGLLNLQSPFPLPPLKIKIFEKNIPSGFKSTSTILYAKHTPP